MRAARSVLVGGIVVGLVLGLAGRASGFAEEDGLLFVDPSTGQTVAGVEVSSVHFDLGYALAACAGFTEADARLIQLYTELPDTQVVTGTAATYSLGVGSLPTTPTALAACGRIYSRTVWPMENQIECPGCFSSRYGPFSAFFHFPRQNEAELGQLRSWAAGSDPSLQAPATYAYGAANDQVVTAPCRYQVTTTIDTGSINAGSLEAFAIYLHALGDSWSHRQCVADMDAAHPGLWGTHTYSAEPTSCAYSNHYTELGGRSADTDRTVAGILAMYAALVERSQQREGARPPLDLAAHQGWLDGQIRSFVYDHPYDNPQSRREHAAQIAQTCWSGRFPQVYLPAVAR